MHTATNTRKANVCSVSCGNRRAGISQEGWCPTQRVLTPHRWVWEGFFGSFVWINKWKTPDNLVQCVMPIRGISHRFKNTRWLIAGRCGQTQPNSHEQTFDFTCYITAAVCFCSSLFSAFHNSTPKKTKKQKVYEHRANGVTSFSSNSCDVTLICRAYKSSSLATSPWSHHCWGVMALMGQHWVSSSLPVDGGESDRLLFLTDNLWCTAVTHLGSAGCRARKKMRTNSGTWKSFHNSHPKQMLPQTVMGQMKGRGGTWQDRITGKKRRGSQVTEQRKIREDKNKQGWVRHTGLCCHCLSGLGFFPTAP